ncbi:hypothetical protein NQ315_008252 [Exocentrus adspersus]|uniref:Transposase n=1 Tax=Exocentrus adspersus TaxID=1586481 RepID=A0AAV8VNH5_9CUCU|nr:hypothetical protein NQ315_008252 [Exocentrus adspersus]
MPKITIRKYYNRVNRQNLMRSPHQLKEPDVLEPDNNNQIKQQAQQVGDPQKLIGTWAIKYNITHVSLNALLHLLKLISPEVFPSDARTLLKTKREVHTKCVDPGVYFHFGVEHCLEKLMSKSTNLFLAEHSEIEILINIVGLPLSKSSSYKKNKKNVDMIGIYHGYEKPKSANCFLEDFVKDVSDALSLTNKHYSVKICAFVCDAPAKSFITYTKGHSGYSSCTKCYIEGDNINRRVCFPHCNNPRIRTDAEFRAKLQEDHHNGTSILQNIPNLDMVTNFPLDYMHLICLRVVKKLIVTLWSCGKPPAKLSYNQLSQISGRLINLSSNMPIEFNRKPRSLLEAKRWKATEFRQFLFYNSCGFRTAIPEIRRSCVLTNTLSPDKYLNFVCLHVSATILSSSSYADYIDYADSLLVYFVNTFITLYKPEYVSHNIHNLLHIAQDVKNLGTLDNFGAFEFENYLQSIIRLVRKNNSPLAQIIKRKSEQDIIVNSGDSKSESYTPYVTNKHFEGPTLINKSYLDQYQKIFFQNFQIHTSEPNNCCMLKNGDIILVKNIISSVNTFTII